MRTTRYPFMPFMLPSGLTGAALRRSVWLIAAGTAFAVTATAVADDVEPAERPLPAAAATQYAADLVTLAEIARAQGLTGLSPLSLAPIDDGVSADARRAAIERDLADIALANHLTGLSPVSLHPINR